jgi:hypothetical protein
MIGLIRFYLLNNVMSFLALLMWAIITGNTVIEYGKQPLDINMVEQVSTQQIQQSPEENQPQKELPFLVWKATWYDYKLWGKWYSKYNDTCALRIKQRWGHYKVCSGDKCVVCRHNDWWPQEYTNKVIDLSSHAFKQLAPLSRWVIEVQIYKLD